MAESSLSVGWPTLKIETGFYLGYGRTIGGWEVPQATLIETLVQSGVRRVYFPPAFTEVIQPHRWSFLKPTTTIAITAGDRDYDLPDDFGSLSGGLHYPAEENRMEIARVSVGRILELRSMRARTDTPIYAAIRYKSSDGSGGQRQEILFWPEPSSNWTLKYSYEAYSGELSDTYPYPLGGMQLAELYIESCLAVAEQRVNREAGLHTQMFNALLKDAINRDSMRGPRIFGQMGNVERGYDSRHFRHGSVSGVTYDGGDL